MALTWQVLVDLTDSGSPDVDISDYWRAVDFVQGMQSEDQHMADVGRCTIVLRNTDKRFSRDNANGPYYGELVKGRAVQVKVSNDNGAYVSQFRGTVQDWVPTPGSKTGPWECRLVVADLLQELQRDDMAIALMEDLQPDVILTLVTNEAFRSEPATGYWDFLGTPTAGDTVNIEKVPAWPEAWDPVTNLGIETYTFKTALTGAANEVLIEADSDGSDITSENLAAAINHDEGEGTDYGTGTNRNGGFSAKARARVGEDHADLDGWVALNDIASGYSKLSTSFMVQTDTITTDAVWLHMRLQGSPTGTITVKFILNQRGLPNDVQYKTVSGTLSEALIVTGWNKVTLSESITFRRYQRYHVELSTNRAASATDYSEWAEISGTNNKSAENTAGTWTSLGTAFVWCIPGRVDIKSRWRGAYFSLLRTATSSTGAVVRAGATLSGGTDAPSGLTDYTTDTDTIDQIGDMWRTSDRIDAKRALKDVCESGRGFLWCAEDGTLTYQPRGWLFERIAATPALTVTNTQNGMDIATEQRMVNRVVVTYTERREVADTVIARAGGSIEIPPNAKVDPTDYENALGSTDNSNPHGLRFNPNDDVEPTTVTLPFVYDGTGTITGAKDITQPRPGTDFTLTTEANGGGRNATYLAQTRGGGMKVPTAIVGGEVQCTFRSTTGLTSLFVNDLQVVGTALITLNPQRAVREDETSIADYGVKPKEITLAVNTSYGASLAESIAEYELTRGKNERTVIQSLYFTGQTMIAGQKLYEVQIGDTVTVTEDQTGIDSATVLVIGRQVREHIDTKTPELTLFVRPISDQTYVIIEDATYGDLPGYLSI